MKPIIMRERLQDIALNISWRFIARNYFGKSSSWIYHKLDGEPTGFTPEETEKLKLALKDFASRINAAADSI